MIQKPMRYEQMGVLEYILYDPSGEYLRPSLQTFRLTSEGYTRVEPNERGQLECRSLGIQLELDGRDLLLRDSRTAEILPTKSEAAEVERDAALARMAALEAELQRLRGQQQGNEARDPE